MVTKCQAAEGANPNGLRIARQAIQQIRIEPGFDPGLPLGLAVVMTGAIETRQENLARFQRDRGAAFLRGNGL